MPPIYLNDKQINLIKYFAAIFMVIDHVDDIIFDRTTHWLFFLGRAVFPLFAYVMGLHFSKNINLQNYSMRLFIWAIIAQPIYLWVFEPPNFCCNVLFTLAASVIFFIWQQKQSFFIRSLIIATLLAWHFPAVNYIEFGTMGILLPYFVWQFLRKKNYQNCFILLGALANLQPYIWIYSNYPFIILTLFGFIVIPYIVLKIVSNLMTHSAKSYTKKWRFAFYGFYPIHMAVLKIFSLLFCN